MSRNEAKRLRIESTPPAAILPDDILKNEYAALSADEQFELRASQSHETVKRAGAQAVGAAAGESSTLATIVAWLAGASVAAGMLFGAYRFGLLRLSK